MITIKFPHNGLPDELRNIPSGQIILLTNPEKGIVAKNVRVLEFIYSMAKQYNQQYIINAIPVNYSGLWDAFICKVDTDKGPQVLAADSSSIIEMLCEFWELDYEAVCKDIDIKPRYPKITCGREDHPIRVDVPATKKSSYTEPDFDGGVNLAFVPKAMDRPTIDKTILTSLIDAEDDFTLKDYMAIWEDAQKQKSIEYELVVKLSNKGNKREPKIQADFEIKDNKGNKYPFKLETLQTAVYLTFLYIGEEGTSLVDFCETGKQHNRYFEKIYDSLYDKRGSTKSITYTLNDEEKNGVDQRKTLTETFSKITKKISEVLPNDKAARKFVILLDKETKHYSTKGSNSYIRFDMQKYFLFLK